MDQLEVISKKIDLIIKLLASRSIEGKSFDDKLVTLTNFGFDNMAIAEMIGAKSSTIRTRKSQLKSKLAKK